MLGKLSVPSASSLGRTCCSGKLSRKVGCILEHCSLCFPCYLQNPPLSTGGEIKRVFIRARAALDATLRPEPRPTQWLIEQGSPSVCSGHTTPEPLALRNPHTSIQGSRAAKEGEGTEAPQVARRHDSLCIQTRGARGVYFFPSFPEAPSPSPHGETGDAGFLTRGSQAEPGRGASPRMMPEGRKKALWLPDQFCTPHRGARRGFLEDLTPFSANSFLGSNQSCLSPGRMR